MAGHEREDFPYENTRATQLLKAGLARAADQRGLSTRAAARELGYKATVVISHMATGRVPIPLDRAAEIAEVIGLPPREFFLAVLEQRHPGAEKVLENFDQRTSRSDNFANELAMLAGCDLDRLSDEHKRILREVVCDRAPARRWLSLAELPTVAALREVWPSFSERGLPKAELGGVERFLKSRT